MLEIDSAPRCRALGRFSHNVFWCLWAAIVVIAAAFYYPKAVALEAPGAQILGGNKYL